MSRPKLVSFSVCPYVQRAVIALEEKGVEYDIEFIDLGNKPQWFLDISPRGKVPVLIDDDVPLFESLAIVQYLDETQPGRSLTPTDPRQRARDRAWATFASEDIFGWSWKMESAKEEERVASAMKVLREKLAIVETALDGRDYLSGDGSTFGLADVAFAPSLYRWAEWGRRGLLDGLFGDLPNVAGWAERVVAPPSVQRSVHEGWADDLAAMGTRMGSWLSQAG